ncbi:MAG: Smr/MutS family protein [Polyangia bacterium]
MAKKSKGFNTPFEELEALRQKLVAEERARKTAPIVITPPAPPPSAPPVEKPEEEVFADEMRGVAQLPPDPRGRVIGGAAAPPPTAPRRRRNDDAEAYAVLADLVDGGGVFDISATDEYVEGIGPGIDKRLLRKLRAGDYAVQAHLDLHGLVSEEARVEVEKFLTTARADGRRCVLIVHGRGHGSKEGIPVLKERLKVWLTRGRIGRGVLAFCSARPSDGGAGAVYVLLRK